MEYGKYYGKFNMHDKVNGEIFSSDNLRTLYQEAYRRTRAAVQAGHSYHIGIFQGCRLVVMLGTNIFGTPKIVVITR